MACNLAALRTLTTVGIQAGHMALHARSVAAAAGATGAEVDTVARMIHRDDAVTLAAARAALAKLRE
jgi:hydroxymethylglutaryl-CoA reductase